MSVNAITITGSKVVFTQDKVEIIKNNKVVLEGNKKQQGLYIVNLNSINNTELDSNGNTSAGMHSDRVLGLTEQVKGNPVSEDAKNSNGSNRVKNSNDSNIGKNSNDGKISKDSNINKNSNASNSSENSNGSNNNQEKSENKTTKLVEWHNKLGHLNNVSVKKLTNMSTGMPDLTQCENVSCSIWVEAKQTRFPFNKVRERASKPLQIIHSDVCGQIEPKTHDSKNYFLTCIDDYTHFCKIYLLKTKYEANQYLKEYINEGEAYFNLKAHKIRCENGGEYVSTNLKQWCKSKGIVLDYTISHTPQLDGIVERMNKTLLNKASAMIFDSEAVLTAAYLLNRSPSTTVDKTPAEKWYGKKPDLSRLQVFGSEAYSKVLGKLKKLDKRSKQMTFVGYAPKF